MPGKPMRGQRTMKNKKAAPKKKSTKKVASAGAGYGSKKKKA